MIEPEAQITSNPLTEPRSKVHLVDNTESLAKFLKALELNNRSISIDAERASGFKYGQKAYLIQIGIQDAAIYLLDPIADFDKGTLDKARQTINSTPWLIHAASQDLTCLAEFGLKPTNLFDTELAGRLLGLPKVSLGTMTEHYLQLKLAKEHSAVDWSQRPFPQSWLDYAALDVDVLPDLHKHIIQDLKDQDKLEIAIQEFTALLNFQVKEPKIDRWRGTTGIHEFKEQRELTIVKHVWEAREALAIAKDISPGRLIPDAAIVAAVREKPKSRSELAAMRSFTGRASRTYIDTWWDSYYKGLTTEKLVELRPKATGIPNHRNWPGKFPQANARLQWSKKLLAQLSIAVNIPQENIIAPDIIRTLCFTPPALDSSTIKNELAGLGVRVWQIELVTELLLESLAKAELPPTEETTV